ncbi:GNAT family N-acetyltransferase [uncultured Prevotella sp.]|uniref:GNAT family N-acetyltransferase n=1 Tax=uncultured Prevotella sp. TaxID=159272 RepID=UPI002617965B|nr:GNAT family N-acetyltransferase [uncultured Prevotella sp.]
MIREISGDSDIRLTAQMAQEIWNEAFRGIITQEQINYMVDKYQSYHAMKDQIENQGYTYFIISKDGKDAGYCGVQVKEDNSLYLSKMYLLKEARGQRLFEQMTNHLVKLCRDKGISRIWLTVNKHNDRAIAAYIKNGYKNIRSQTTDIGNGFVMDDYVFELNTQC